VFLLYTSCVSEQRFSLLIKFRLLIKKIILHITGFLTDVMDFFLVVSDLKWIEMQIERARSMSPGKFNLDKNRPHCFLKTVLVPCFISAAEKRNWHIRLIHNFTNCLLNQ
jgi:hypothetical protein